MKGTVINILEDIMMDIPDNLESFDAIIDDGLLDSFDIVNLVNELDDEFDVDINVNHLIPENFNSVDAICNLIKSLEE